MLLRLLHLSNYPSMKRTQKANKVFQIEEGNLTLTSRHKICNGHGADAIEAYLTSFDTIRSRIRRGNYAHLFDLEGTFPQIVQVVNTSHSSPLDAIRLQTLHCAHLKICTTWTGLVGHDAAHQVSHGRAEGRSNVGSHVLTQKGFVIIRDHNRQVQVCRPPTSYPYYHYFLLFHGEHPIAVLIVTHDSLTIVLVMKYTVDFHNTGDSAEA